MKSALVLIGVVTLVGVVYGRPRTRPSGNATILVPAEAAAVELATISPRHTIPAGAQAAAIRQAASQAAQAHRAAIQNALAQAAAAQTVGDEAQHAAVRDAIAQTHAERILAENNQAHLARNSVAQAQAVEIQIAQNRAVSGRNAVVQAVQGSRAAAAQAVSNAHGRVHANSARVIPSVVEAPVEVAPAVTVEAPPQPAAVISEPELSLGPNVAVVPPALSAPAARHAQPNFNNLGGGQFVVSGHQEGFTGAQLAYAGGRIERPVQIGNTGAQLAYAGAPIGRPIQIGTTGAQLAYAGGPIVRPVQVGNTGAQLAYAGAPIGIHGAQLALAGNPFGVGRRQLGAPIGLTRPQLALIRGASPGGHYGIDGSLLLPRGPIVPSPYFGFGPRIPFGGGNYAFFG